MSKPSVAFGVPFYHVVDGAWWTHTADFLMKSAAEVEYHRLLASGAMTADHSRNLIAAEFLKSTKADWLFWIDSDTQVPAGALSRLLALGKTLASGLYYGKNPPHPPIAYYRLDNGTYIPIDRNGTWERGEILPVDAAGFGCMLTHRSVFEDILKNFRVLQLADGGITVVHNEDFVGPLLENAGVKTDGKT